MLRDTDFLGSRVPALSFYVIFDRKDPFLGYALVAFRSGAEKICSLATFRLRSRCPSSIVVDEKIERNRS